MGYRNAPDEPGRPSGGARRVHRRFGALSHGEGGQSLVVVVIAMTVIVGVAALAIDASDWLAKRHKAQVTADAAALAAANYMGTMIAENGSAPSSSGVNVATTYAADNGLPITADDVSITQDPTDTVTVTVPTTGSLFFAGISLGSGPSISARAVASWKTRDCGTAGANCAFAFAADDVCSGNTGVTSSVGMTKHGITLAKSGTGSNIAITGDVVSASNITLSINGQPKFNSTAVYPVNDGATPTPASCSGPTPGTPSAPFASAIQHAVTDTFPIDYRNTYVACSPTGAVKCDASGFPSYCTVDSTLASYPTITTVANNAIYCDAGSGTTSDPSTWNGAITVSAGGGNATYIGGKVTLNIPTNSTFEPASGQNLLAYAADCNSTRPPTSFCPATATAISTPAVSISSNGNATIGGDVFAAGGVIDVTAGGTPSITGFLEAWDVVYNANGTVIADGPQVNNQGYFVGDYLIQ